MSCDIAAAGAIWLASLGASGSTVPPGQIFALPLRTIAAATSPLAAEPLYADIISRAGRLKTLAEHLRSAKSPLLGDLPSEIDALSALDLKAHLDLAARGTDGDLKCILKGISMDLPRKLAEVQAANTSVARTAALNELVYLLRDNVEVLTAPPAPPA